MRVLVVPDKFKGTLTAQAAAEAIAAGWTRARPQDSLALLPMSDGGDGFGAVLGALLGARPRFTSTCDAAHRPCRSQWWWDARTRTAIIESAAVIGLAMLPSGRFHPFQLDSFGLAKVIRAAISAGARRMLVGLGGSATNDAGFGLARGLGWKFFGSNEKLLQTWPELDDLQSILPPSTVQPSVEVIGAVDVQNLLLGPAGATRVYGPQKGLTAPDFAVAERRLRRLALLMRRLNRQDASRLPGAGAAGGLGFAIPAFLAGTLQPGFELFSAEAELSRRLRGVELVVTGEGCIDSSTYMGKGAGEIARLCRKLRIPCVGLGGMVRTASAATSGFLLAKGVTELVPLRKALARPSYWLEQLAFRVSGAWPDPKSGDRRRPDR